ncbi:hypothetical protein KCU95_g15, partial [Aureobasidium melanogenum]
MILAVSSAVLGEVGHQLIQIDHSRNRKVCCNQYNSLHPRIRAHSGRNDQPLLLLLDLGLKRPMFALSERFMKDKVCSTAEANVKLAGLKLNFVAPNQSTQRIGGLCLTCGFLIACASTASVDLCQDPSRPIICRVACHASWESSNRDSHLRARS